MVDQRAKEHLNPESIAQIVALMKKFGLPDKILDSVRIFMASTESPS
jgi:hypothetical protein